MTTILLIAIFFLVALCIFFYTKPVRQDMRVMRMIGQLTIDKHALMEQLAQRNREYDALETGLDEQVDNYENQFLAFKERIAYLEKANDALVEENQNLEREALHHRQNCLPSLAGMTEMAREGVLGTYKVE